MVPLALGLISVSNPQLHILDTLSKFSHDADAEVAHNSIFAMGLIGAGTNNARLAAMLRQVRIWKWRITVQLHFRGMFKSIELWHCSYPIS